ncbi:alpha/beta hydrolase [Arachnia propionica]|uniref:Alpha/beta hydrolase n=1 Tax=Arachnia propionica TaxID=1750 RepID=A0A3P1T6S2_9ACTN|nr:alpha/beta hydrolase [Arachnia propionica]MDO5083987.1 alpha/beta hydrolase [Arachnia propionica]RRD05217.1 alpha/beta hydrolase [Arachnia propionica]
MRDWVSWVQRLLILIAIGLVVSFFVGGMVLPRQQPESSPTPGEAEPSVQTPPAVGTQQPGVPSVPVAEHETWDDPSGLNPDRQVTYEGAGAPSVTLPAALGDTLQPYWEQTLEWTDCQGGQCAVVKVPLDWENPGKAALEISLLRIPAKESSRGPLFVNPGGPGFGGKEFAQTLGSELQGSWEGYDIVSWDPRGTGDSTRVQCGTTEQTDAAFTADTTPDDEAEQVALREAWSGFAQQCRDASGELLDHLTTIENVRDLDLVRFLLGAEKLNYVGVSYGTYVGAVYAELFPENTGRLVLDSAVDITNDEAVAQSEGFELAFRNYADWCVAQGNCALGGSTDEIVASTSEFIKGLDATPLTVGNRTLTQAMGATGIALFLYSGAEQYPVLTQAIVKARAGDGAMLLQASDLLNGRGQQGWETVAYAFPATRCVDDADLGITVLQEQWQELLPKSPLFAANMGVDYTCELWTADSAPHLKLTGTGAAPILVVGSTGDSATPYQHAVTMAQQLESGNLLTYDGPGHGAVTAGNACVDEAVAAYLLEGTIPAEGTTCKA